MKKEETNQRKALTSACVLRSKNIAIAKAARVVNRQQQYLCNMIPPMLPSRCYLDEIMKELDVRIDGYKRDIALYLKQIVALNNKDIKVPELEETEARYHFSTRDIKSGYLFFYKNAASTWITGVLILNDSTDLEMGTIYEFNEVKDKLKDLEDQTVKDSVAYIRSVKKIEEDE